MPVLKTTSPDLDSGAPNEKLRCHANEGTPNPSNTVPSASTNFPFSTSRSMHVSPKFGIIFDSTSGHASSPVSLSITSTYPFPMMGNYGVPGDELDEWGLPKYFESDAIHVAGVIVADYSWEYSHWAAKKSLGEWLKVGCVCLCACVSTPQSGWSIPNLLRLLQEW